MKTRVAYKVCSHPYGSNHLESTNATGSRTVTYRVNKVVRPNRGQNPFLFVFKTLKDARDYQGSYGNRRVIKGLAVNPKGRAKGTDGSPFFSCHFPKGTVFCDAFVAMEKVVR